MLKLKKCTELNESMILSYKEAFVDETMHGGARLSDAESVAEWKERLRSNELIDLARDDKVRSTTYFLVDDQDYPLGIIDIRHRLNDYLLQYGGHIGYSVRKDERQKGYAKIMLKEALKICKDLGLDRVLITADENNPASYRTIESQGGILENRVTEDNGNVMRRYWIEIA